MKLLNNNQKQSAIKHRSYGNAIFRRLCAATLALSSFLFLTSCAGSTTERVERVGGLTASQVIENPSAYVGKTVTVSGDVEKIHGPRAFEMDSGISVGELLVIGRDPFPQIPEVGNRAYLVKDVVTVTGVVRMMVTADIEQEIGWDLDPQIEAEFNAKPVLIAQSVNFKPNANRSALTPNAGQTQTNASGSQLTANNNAAQTAANNNANQTVNNGSQSTAGNKLTDTGIYASTPDKLSLVGKETQFSNARVVRVVGPRTFTVASGTSEIYVMLNEESARGVGSKGEIGAGKTLNLNGRFERLEAEEISRISDNRFRPLTAQEREFLKNTAVYLQADKVSDLD